MRLLILQHISCEHPGAFRDVMGERGVETVTAELDEGEALPDWRDFDGIVSMGGPMSANDEAEHPWIAAEKRAIREAAGAGRAVLGVCLGAQMLASALGAGVRPMPASEVGLLPVERTEAGRADRVLGRLEAPIVTLQWHGDTFDLPRGAVSLASSAVAANQAFRVGDRAYGLQFHLEVDAGMAREWAEVPAYREALAATLGDEGGRAFLAEVEARADELGKQARVLIEGWLDAAGAAR